LPGSRPGGQGSRGSIREPEASRLGLWEVPQRGDSEAGGTPADRKRYRRYGLSPNALQQILATADRPDLVLVGSMMTYWYPGVVEAIGEVRTAWPGVPVLLGGNYATLCPEHARAFSGRCRDCRRRGVCAACRSGGSVRRPRRFRLRRKRSRQLPYPAMDLMGRLDAVPILTSRAVLIGAATAPRSSSTGDSGCGPPARRRRNRTLEPDTRCQEFFLLR